MLTAVYAADAAKKDPEQFKIWRENPAKFSFEGRYPLLEVYDKAKEAWKGVFCLLPTGKCLQILHWHNDHIGAEDSVQAKSAQVLLCPAAVLSYLQTNVKCSPNWSQLTNRVISIPG